MDVPGQRQKLLGGDHGNTFSAACTGGFFQIQFIAGRNNEDKIFMSVLVMVSEIHVKMDQIVHFKTYDFVSFNYTSVN